MLTRLKLQRCSIPALVWGFVVALAGGSGASLVAATVTWDGSSSGSWGTSANWNTNSLPTASDTAAFNAGSAGGNYSITLGSNRSVLGMTFASAFGSNAFTFNGNTLTIGTGGVTNNDADTQTFNSAVSISSAQTWNAASGGLTFNGTITLGNNLTLSGVAGKTISLGAITVTGNRTITNNSAGTVNLTGNIARNSSNRSVTFNGSGTTNVSGNIGNLGSGTVTKSGTGTAVFSGTNSYTGATNVTSGTLVAASNSALGGTGSGTTVSSGATLGVQGGVSIGSEALTISGSGVGSGGALRNISGSNSLAGNITIAANNTIIASDAGTLTLGGTIARNSGNRSITLTGSGDIVANGAIGNLGSGTVTKSGTGTVTLAGSNTYTGATNITAGTLVAASNNALGGTSNGTTVSSGATLALQGNIATPSGESIAISGTGAGANGALRNISGSNTVAGAVTLTGNAEIQSDSGTITISGAVAGSGGSRALAVDGSGNTTVTGNIASTISTVTKTGSGTLTLSGNNTYSGATTVTAGTLAIGSNSAISSGTLNLGSGTTVTASGGARSISNTVAASGNFTVGGSNNLTFSGSVGLGAGDRTVTVSNTGITRFTGVVSQDYYANVVKEGPGRLELSNANTFQGSVLVNAGTLAISSSSALGTNTWNNVVANGATLELSNNIAVNEGGFTVTGTGVGGTAGAINNLSGSNSISAQIQLGGATTINAAAGSLAFSGQTLMAGNNLTVAGAGDVSFSAQLDGSGSTVTKTGSGTLTLSGANSYTGTTTVSGGTLNIQNNMALGSNAGGAVVNSGATLALEGGITVSQESLTMTGSGTSGSGALQNASGANTWDGPIALGGAATIRSVAGSLNVGVHGSPVSSETDTLAIGTNQLTVNTDAGSSVTINSLITGTSGSVVKDGAGTLTIAGLNNTYTGTTTVNNGLLQLATRSYIAPNQGILGDVVIGDGIGVSLESDAKTAIFRYTSLGSNLMADTVNVTVNKDGLFDLNGKSDLINSLTLVGGDVTTGAGTLQLNGNIDFQSAPGFESSIAGFLTFNGGVRTITVANSTTGRIDATMNTGGYIKEGNGTLIVTSNDASTYGGTTTINAGVVNVRANNALGQGNSSSLASGTEVNAGALELQGGITISSERLTLGSTGVANGGGLRNVSGNNTWSGTINLDGTSRINSDAGTLTLNGSTMNMTNYGLTVGGASDTVISRVITSDVSSYGDLTKDGAGTLYLSGNNTYRGDTLITQGAVEISHGYALGDTGGTTTISSNAALRLTGDIASGEVISLTGSGQGSTGAIRNVSGNNTLSGAMTLTGASRINSDAGTLTLSGGIGGSGQNLTFGGAGSTTVSGAINTGTGTVTKDGSGTLTLAAASGYTGLTSVNAGTLEFGAHNVLGTSNFVATATGSVVDLNGFNQSIAGITGTGSLLFGGAQLTLNGSSTFSGSFAEAGTLIIGPGASLTFGANFNDSSLNIVLAGGTLNLNGTNSTFGSLTVTAASVLDFGAGQNSIVQFTTGVTSNNLLEVRNWVDMVDYFYSSVDAGTQGQAPLNNIVFDGWEGDNTQWRPYETGPYNDFEITPVPEPEVYGAALVTGLLALATWHRRRMLAKR